jgi:hypothetical protein
MPRGIAKNPEGLKRSDWIAHYSELSKNLELESVVEMCLKANPPAMQGENFSTA